MSNHKFLTIYLTNGEYTAFSLVSFYYTEAEFMAFFQFEADKSHESEKTADDIKTELHHNCSLFNHFHRSFTTGWP